MLLLLPTVLKGLESPGMQFSALKSFLNVEGLSP